MAESSANVSPSGKPVPEQFGCSDDVIKRVEAERARRDAAQRRAANRLTKSDLLWAVPFTGVLSAGLITGVGLLGLLVTLPIFAVTQSPTVWLIAAGVLVGGLTIYTLSGSRSPAGSVGRATESDEPLATPTEIESAERYSRAVAEWRRNAWDTWEGKDGYAFERDLGGLLRTHGWSVRVTQASGDGGIDILGTDATGQSVVIQCKWWADPCGVTVVRELAGVIAVHHAGAYGIVVCKGGFTAEARQFASQARIQLWDREAIRSLLEKQPHKSNGGIGRV